MNTRNLCRFMGHSVLGAVAVGQFSMRSTSGSQAVSGSSAIAGTHFPTISGAMASYGKKSDIRFRAVCQRSGIAYPPRRVTLVALKKEKLMEIWGANSRGSYKRIAVYPILAASGKSGPKRKSGDCQVPEGFYRISALNPASQFHLSMRVSYPNSEDVAHRTVAEEAMGGDIYVHGNAVSIGCLAMGDPAIEEIFCLVAQSNTQQRRILIVPQDFRRLKGLPRGSDPWMQNIYGRLQRKLRRGFTV